MTPAAANWRARCEQLTELLGLAGPVLEDIERDGLTDETRPLLKALRMLVSAEVPAA